MAIKALDKPADSWCRHCKPGQGCGAYETRPDECRTFSCLWLIDPSFPEKLKPDHARVVFVLEAGGNRVGAYVDGKFPLAWRAPEVHDLLRRMAMVAGAERQVIVYVRGTATAVLPDRDVELGPYRIGQKITYRPSGAGPTWRIEAELTD